MISDTLIDYILDNINKKDFFSKEFLYYFRNIILKDIPDIKYVFEDIEVINGFNSVSYYDTAKVYLSSKCINKDFKICQKDYNNLENTLYNRNLFILENLLHESLHAYQRYLYFTEESLLTKILHDGDLVLKGNFSYNRVLDLLPKDIKGAYFYNKYHDIFPFELHADILANIICLNVYNMSKEYTSFREYDLLSMEAIINNYVVSDKFITSPLKRFYSLINESNKLIEYDMSKFSLVEQFILGYVSDLTTINSLCNKLMNTKDKDYLEGYSYVK